MTNGEIRNFGYYGSETTGRSHVLQKSILVKNRDEILKLKAVSH